MTIYINYIVSIPGLLSSLSTWNFGQTYVHHPAQIPGDAHSFFLCWSTKSITAQAQLRLFYYIVCTNDDDDDDDDDVDADDDNDDDDDDNDDDDNDDDDDGDDDNDAAAADDDNDADNDDNDDDNDDNDDDDVDDDDVDDDDDDDDDVDDDDEYVDPFFQTRTPTPARSGSWHRRQAWPPPRWATGSRTEDKGIGRPQPKTGRPPLLFFQFHFHLSFYPSRISLS